MLASDVRWVPFRFSPRSLMSPVMSLLRKTRVPGGVGSQRTPDG